MSYSTALIKKCQSRLKRKDIVKIAKEIRELLEVMGYDESKDSVDYFWEQIKIFFLSEEESSDESPEELKEGENYDESSEELKEEIKATDVMNEVILDELLEFSPKEINEILSGIKSSFDSQEEALHQVKSAIENYLIHQERKREELIDDIQDTATASLNSSNVKTQEILNNLAKLKEDNDFIYSQAEILKMKYEQSIIMRNRLTGCIFLLAITLLGVIPFTMNFQKAQSVNYIEKQCSQQSQKKINICNKRKTNE
jgi:DNA-binding transcriptional MerR regulator